MCKGPGAVRNMATSNKLRKASVVESREVWRNGLWWVEKQASRLYAPLLSFIILHGYTLFWPPPLPPSLFCDAGDGTQGHLYVTVLPWSYIPSLLLFWFEPKSSQGLSTGLKLYFEETCIGCYSPHLQPV
jgi:hypothetical protein